MRKLRLYGRPSARKRTSYTAPRNVARRLTLTVSASWLVQVVGSPGPGSRLARAALLA